MWDYQIRVVGRRTTSSLIVSIVLCVAYPASADFTGKVIAVADGDTLTVLYGGVQVKVRLTEIDAPEGKQNFGNRSKQSLSDLCFGESAVLAEKGKDRYGRTLARVTCAGVDANAEQVRRGMAWAYTRYLTDSGIEALEAEARAAERGLWRDHEPVPPWDWRTAKREASKK